MNRGIVLCSTHRATLDIRLAQTASFTCIRVSSQATMKVKRRTNKRAASSSSLASVACSSSGFSRYLINCKNAKKRQPAPPQRRPFPHLILLALVPRNLIASPPSPQLGELALCLDAVAQLKWIARLGGGGRHQALRAFHILGLFTIGGRLCIRSLGFGPPPPKTASTYRTRRSSRGLRSLWFYEHKDMGSSSTKRQSQAKAKARVPETNPLIRVDDQNELPYLWFEFIHSVLLQREFLTKSTVAAGRIRPGKMLITSLTAGMCRFVWKTP